MKKLRAIIIDDEAKGRKNLHKLLENNCPEIQVEATADSAVAGRQMVERHQPDVVFLDINMPIHNGFDFLEFFTEREFSVVFVTAYNEYALRAIKSSAVDYLLKPVDIFELKRAVKKLQSIHERPDSEQEAGESLRGEQTQLLLENLKARGSYERIILHMPRSIKIVRISEIVYLQAESNYSTVFLDDGAKVTISRTLKEFEEILSGDIFYRIHKSFLINLQHVKEYFFARGGAVCMSNGHKLQVSSRRSKEFLQHIEAFASSTHSGNIS